MRIFLFIFFFKLSLQADPPKNYYSSAIGKKGDQKAQQKHTCKKVANAIPRTPERFKSRCCGPLKQFKDPRFKHLTKGLATLHWCLAAQWRIPKWLIKVPGHIAIFFGWFLELRNLCKNLGLEKDNYEYPHSSIPLRISTTGK